MSRLVTVSTYGRTGGSARVRVFDWLDWLGIEAESETYAGTSDNAPSTILRHASAALHAEWRLRRLVPRVGGRTLLLSRQASPFSRGGLERSLLTAAGSGVYDFDDALYLADAGSGWSQKSRVWQAAVCAASSVIAGNETLADHASDLNPNVVVIPSCVDPGDYERKHTYECLGPPRAVWIGSPSTEVYLRDIAEALLRIHRSRGLRLTLISAGSAPLGELDDMVDRVPWQLDTFASELANADLGVMPLPDTAWTRGKCAYKLLQYAAAGLPLIGSPVGANREVLRQAGGLAPVTEDDWSSALEELIDESDAQRANRGDEAWIAVSRGFSFQAWQEPWRRVLDLPNE